MDAPRIVGAKASSKRAALLQHPNPPFDAGDIAVHCRGAYSRATPTLKPTPHCDRDRSRQAETPLGGSVRRTRAPPSPSIKALYIAGPRGGSHAASPHSSPGPFGG